MRKKAESKQGLKGIRRGSIGSISYQGTAAGYVACQDATLCVYQPVPGPRTAQAAERGDTVP